MLFFDKNIQNVFVAAYRRGAERPKTALNSISGRRCRLAACAAVQNNL